MKIEGKNIIVTGASSGIGRILVEYLSTYPNVKIVAAARREQLIPQKENVVFPISLDVSTEDGVDELFTFAWKKLGHIDIFIANAGFAYAEKIETPDWKHIVNIFNLNVFSPIYSLEKFARTSNSPIHFVALISGVAYFPLPAYSLYCSTKSALKLFFETYHYEKENNLTISTVYPVATHTEFFERASEKSVSLPFLRQDKESVARKIIQGIIHDKRNIYPSLLFRICLPIVRIFPCFVKLYSLNEKRKINQIL